MFVEERQQLISELVAAKGRVSVQDLAVQFAITQETVRRDLGSLEEVGVLRRVHGGAVSMEKISLSEATVSERSHLALPEKQRIADVAARIITANPTASVLLDAGTTTGLLAQSLVSWSPQRRGQELLIITNSLPIASTLSSNHAINVELLGGRIRGVTSAAVGPETERQLAILRPDLAFIGTNGIDAEFGLSTPDSQEAAVKRAMTAVSRRIIVLVDSSKFNQAGLVKFAALADIDGIITDAAPDAGLSAALDDAGVEVTQA